MKKPIAICWFRSDLRLSDNPALSESARFGSVIPTYIWDETSQGKHAPGETSRWWLHHSLIALNTSLGGTLSVHAGDAAKIIPKIARANAAEAVFWNRCYEPWRVKNDVAVERALKKCNIVCKSLEASLLIHPDELLKKNGTPYKVFTPFYRTLQGKEKSFRKPLAKPRVLRFLRDASKASSIEALQLDKKNNRLKKLARHWKIGEAAAKRAMTSFVSKKLSRYAQGRDFPADDATSRLSPYLHHGELSPSQVWYAASGVSQGARKFLSEVAWREFAYNVLYHFPRLPDKNVQEKFDFFPWKRSANCLKAWQEGRTGYPIVDAGMRELWQTGYMHNRVRMIAASFLVKNMLIHWHKGRDWFWQCLVDADLANNSASWQWVSGCGFDAAPYFRIFNPVLQGEKCDPRGTYTRKYVPELKKLPKKYLFKPWEAPDEVLEKSKIELGKTYPMPIVDLVQSRDEALLAYKRISRGSRRS